MRNYTILWVKQKVLCLVLFILDMDSYEKQQERLQKLMLEVLDEQPLLENYQDPDLPEDESDQWEIMR